MPLHKLFLIIFCTSSSLSLFSAEPVLTKPIPSQAPLTEAPKKSQIKNDFGNETELRVAYFRPTSPRLRSMYKGARIDYGVETAQRIVFRLFSWANISCYPDSGHTLGIRQHTSLLLTTVSAGLKYSFSLHARWKFSLGIGPAYYFLQTHEKSLCSSKSHSSFHDWGVVAKSQLQWFFFRTNYVDLFADYLFLPLHGPEDHVGETGGIKAGIGIGKHF